MKEEDGSCLLKRETRTRVSKSSALLREQDSKKRLRGKEDDGRTLGP